MISANFGAQPPQPRIRLLYKPASAGGILIAPGVSPGIKHQQNLKPALAGDRNRDDRFHAFREILSPLTGLSEFFWFL